MAEQSLRKGEVRGSTPLIGSKSQKMSRQYSRLAKIQEKKTFRSALVFGILTIIFGLFMVFFGIQIVSRFASFVINIKGSTTVVDNEDNIPPGPPFLKTLPEATSNQDIQIEGSSEPGAKVTIVLNNSKKEVIADVSGQFSVKMSLDKGINTIYSFAVDTSGNNSVETKKYEVTFDNEKPNLEITKPKDGESFSGKSTQKLTIEGKTKAGASVTINDRFVNVANDGNFTYQFTLSDGENSLNIKTTDKSGNQTEKTIKVNYSL